MENCGNLRNKQKTLKIAEGGGGGGGGWTRGCGEAGARKVYAKQQTKQSRQLICWQRKGKCPNIYSILYKAQDTQDMGHTQRTQDTVHGTWANNFVLVGKENLRAKRQVAGQTAGQQRAWARELVKHFTLFV